MLDVGRRSTSWKRLPVVAVVLAGCASSAPGEAPPNDEPTVELVVHNERSLAVTAYVQWQGLRPIRLGVIGAGRSATYLPGFRNGELCVLMTAAGNTSFSTAVPEREPAFRCSGGVRVERGQRMDVILREDQVCYLQEDPDC